MERDLIVVNWSDNGIVSEREAEADFIVVSLSDSWSESERLA